MSTSIFSSWKVRIISAVLLAAIIYLTIESFKRGYEEGRQLRKAVDRAAEMQSTDK